MMTFVGFFKCLEIIIGDFLLFLERDDSRFNCLNWVIPDADPRCCLAPQLCK